MEFYGMKIMNKVLWKLIHKSKIREQQDYKV